MVEEAGVTLTEHCYIIRKRGILSEEPIVKGTRTPVRAVVELWRLGYAPEEICSGLPHLSLAAVFDALSYYCDHSEEINQHIAKNGFRPNSSIQASGTCERRTVHINLP